MCVFTAMLMWAYTTWALLQRQLMVITRYTWSHLLPADILYCTLGLNSRFNWLQLISWYQWAWASQLAFLQESVLVFDPFHWNGVIIISIIINQNHHNNNHNNNIKNIQMMDTEVIQNTLLWNKQKWKQDTTIRHASKRLCLARKQFAVS